MTRRSIIRGLAGLAPAAWGARAVRAQAGAPRRIAPGIFQPTWESLSQYQAPDWFRDAKFGIWAHWTAQCVPEQGDWYARKMYIQGDPANQYHVEHYGHPSQFGFMQIDNLWKAESWEPEALMELYVKAGARYFVALANHHDNFDCYDSTHHKWNSVRIGPKRDIVGAWAKIARSHGLRFGVTNHSAHSWHWFQTAYDYDQEGPLAGVRYDAFTTTKEQGGGKWWDGLDPQDLYTGRNMVMPDGIATIQAADEWHREHDRKWTEQPPPNNPGFVDEWFLRCQELVDKYRPDLLYFDDTGLPLGQAGLDIAAHYYNANMKNHGGKLEAVLNSKGLEPNHAGTMVLDIERGRADKILPAAWQTDTCIGDWHYRRSIFENHTYKTAGTVIQMLVDIVSKNGNLLLNIPLRGSGAIDEDERKVLDGIASWMPNNREAIFGARPFTVFGEGAPDVKGSGNFNERNLRPYTAEDIRFTTKNDALYAIALAWPAGGKLTIKTLASGSEHYPREVGQVELLASQGALPFTRDAAGLVVTLPAQKPNDYAFALKIRAKSA
ncbi:MAG: alpha-L-fucosidase [Bryobacteraceae bacterium]